MSPRRGDVPTKVGKLIGAKLPTGWECRRDQTSGRLYFLDRKTKTTTWDDPRPLPQGWEKHVESNGRVVFVDQVEHVKTFKDPRPPIPESCVKTKTGRSSKSTPKVTQKKQIA